MTRWLIVGSWILVVVVGGEFNSLREVREKLEADLSSINNKLLEIYGSKSGESACTIPECLSRQPQFSDVVEEQFPPVYYEKLELGEERPFGKWPDAGTTDWDLIRQGLKPDDTSRLLQEESTTTSTANPDEDVTLTAEGTPSVTTTESSAGNITESTTNGTTDETRTTTAATSDSSTTLPAVDEETGSLKVHWEKVGVYGVHKITPNSHRVFESDSRDKLECAVSDFEDYLVENFAEGKGTEEKPSAEVGFYRFVGTQADTTIFYPHTPYCTWKSPVNQPFVPRTTLGTQRILVRVLNGDEMWAPFGLSSLTAFYDYASTDLSRQNTKMLLTWIDSLTEEDELAIAFFEPLEAEEDLDFGTFGDPESTWTIYPSKQSNGSRFYPMNTSNKKIMKEKVTDYHETFVREFGFQDRNFLKTLQRNQTAVFHESLLKSIQWFDEQKNITGSKCHNLIFQVDTLNESVTRLRGGSMTGQASVDVDLIPTTSQLREVAWQLNQHHITFSRIQSTYIDVHTSDPQIFRFDTQSYLAAHRSERSMEAPTAGDVDNYGANPLSAVLLKPPTVLSCVSGGLSLCSPYNVLWDYIPFHSSDISSLYKTQNATVYMTVQDELREGVETLMGCRPVYLPSGETLGVGCLDIKKYVKSQQNLQSFSDYESEMQDMLKNGRSPQCPFAKALESDLFADFSEFQDFIDDASLQINRRFTECKIIRGSYEPNTLQHKTWDEVEPGTYPATSGVHSPIISSTLIAVIVILCANFSFGAL